jgi:hypothetical protein
MDIEELVVGQDDVIIGCGSAPAAHFAAWRRGVPDVQRKHEQNGFDECSTVMIVSSQSKGERVSHPPANRESVRVLAPSSLANT